MKNVFLVAMLLCVGSVTFAQNSNGFKGGANIANLHSTDGTNSASGDQIISINAGFYFENQSSKHFATQIEIMLSVQGTSFSGPFGEINQQLYYANLPVLMKYVANKNFGIYAGPQIGYLIATNEINGQDFKDELSPVDLALVFGAEVKFSGNFRLGARYNHGLLNIDDSEFANEFDIRTTNRVFQIYFGIGF